MTYDQMAAMIICSKASRESKDRQLAALAKRAQVAIGTRCPACDSTKIEDGSVGRFRSFRCEDCDEQFGDE